MNTYRQDVTQQDTHSKVIGYLLWIFGFTGAPDARQMVSSLPQSLMPPDFCRTIAAIRRVFPEFDPRVQSTNGLRTTQKAVIKLRANQKEPRLMRPFFKTWLTICLLMPLAAHATNRERGPCSVESGG